MSVKLVNDDSLTSVANAIRVQGGFSATLEFPDGFVSAIQNLSPSPTLQTKTKTYTPTTSQQTESVTADSGYDGLSEVDVTVNAIPSQYKDTTDATATASEILSGYTAYANGQKLVGTASGGITPSGTYSITSNGIYDIVSFASVDVNVSGGGGGDTDVEDGIINRTISGAYTNSRVTIIGSYAFFSCSKLTAISFPNVTAIQSSAFAGCSSLATASFNNLTNLGNYAFRSCRSLMSVYILGSTVPSCTSNTFGSTPIANSTYTGAYGSIYVPASLVDSYKASTAWSFWTNRITAYTE